MTKIKISQIEPFNNHPFKLIYAWFKRHLVK